MTVITQPEIQYRLLVQGRNVAEGPMEEISEKANRWSKLIVDVRIEPVAS